MSTTRTVALLGSLLLVAALLGCTGDLVPPPGGTAPATKPGVTSIVATAITGALNDTIVIQFNDTMLTGGGANAADMLGNYTVESPIGTTLTFTATTIAAAGGPTAVTLTLADPAPGEDNLQFGDTLRVTVAGTVQNGSGTDIATAGGTATLDTTVGGDNTGPSVSSAGAIAGSPNDVLVQYDETLDQTSAETLTNYQLNAATAPTGAVLQSNRQDVLLTFAGAVTPGTDTLDVAGVADLAGNVMTSVTGQAIVANVPNVTGGVLTAVTGALNDTIEVTFDDEMTTGGGANASDNLANYGVESPTGSALGLAGSTLVVTQTTPNTIITLTLDGGGAGTNLQFGATFTVTVATNVTNVAGFDLTAGVNTATGTVGGDSTGPAVTSATQVRAVDITGQTVDVLFDEAVEQTSAETTGNYTFAGTAAPSVTSATLQPDGVTVSLVLGALAFPPDHTLDVANVADLAGNAMTAATGIAVATDDATAPNVTLAVAVAVANEVSVTFDDDMHVADVQDAARYAFESPTGTTVTFTGAGVYNAGTKTVVFTTATALTASDTFTLTYKVGPSPIRDLGGNDLVDSSSTGTVTVAGTPPTITTVAPNAGPFLGAQAVVITGTDFDDVGGVTVTIGGIAAVVGTVTPTQIDITTGNGTSLDTGAGPQVVDVVVTNTATTLFDTLAGGYTYGLLRVPGDYGTIQAGINASGNGDTVEVTDGAGGGGGGAYTGAGNIDIDYGGRAITVRSTGGAAVVDVASTAGSRGFIFQNAEPATAVLDGFTIQGGAADDSATPPRIGGGIFINAASPTIQNCTLKNNVAATTTAGMTGSGGAVFINGGAPTFLSCTFDTNMASAQGNGSQASGGAITITAGATPSFRICTISNNTVSVFGGGGANDAAGGGILWAGGGAGVLDRSRIFSNQVTAGADDTAMGGGVAVSDAGTTVTITNTSIYGNQTDLLSLSGGFSLGAGLSVTNGAAVTVRHSSIADNRCTAFGPGTPIIAGGGILASSTASVTLNGAIVFFNVAASAGAQITVVATTTAFTIDYSDIANAAGDIADGGNIINAGGGLGGGTGNISADPLYTSLAGGNLTLQTGSPAIDAGDPASPVTEDQTGAVRPQSLGFDMGEFEQ